jgi:hypothetical protein
MKHSQKGFGAVRGLIILTIVGLLAFIGWSIWNATKEDTNKTYSAACSTTAQTNNNYQLPSDWNWYEIKAVGLKYAYPKSWGSPTTQTNSGSQNYVASFTITGTEANTMVSLIPTCSDFKSNLSNINSGKFDILSGSTITKAIKHDETFYSSLSHWSSDAGNQYKLVTYSVVSAGSINTVEIDYSVVTGTQVCPDDRLASSDQPKCINQSISDEVDQVIGSLRKI